jgi:O-antigen ligase
VAPFFALLDTRTPLRNTIYGVVANLVLLPTAVGAMTLVGRPPVLGVAVAYSIAVYVNVAHAAYRVRAIAGSPWSGMATFALKVMLASALSALAMLPAERWLGLDRPHPRLVELAGVVEVAVIGLLVLGGALGLLFFKELRRRRYGTDVTLPPAPRNEITSGASVQAQRGGSLFAALGIRAMGSDWVPKALFGLGAAAILGVSVEAAYTLATGGPKLLVVIPISVLIGLALVIVGLIDFQLFAFITIAIRSSLDIARPELGNNGTASGSGTAFASGLDPAGALAVIFMVASLFWFMSRRMAKATSPSPSVHRIALSTFAITGYLSVIASARPLVSLLEAIRVSAVAVMLVVMEILLVDRAAIKRLILAIYLSALVPVGLTLFYIVLHKPQFTSGGFGRYQGTFSQPNPFAIYLTMLIIMGAALLPHLKLRVRILMVVLMAASVVCLYHTYTRSAWVATVIGLVAVAIIGRRKVLGATLLACLVVGLIAVPTISQRFADLASVAGGGSTVNAQGNTSNSVVWRFSYWSQVLPLANSNPVTGIGLKMSSFMTDQAKEPHNDFLRAYVETGIVGALAYFALLISMIMVARQGLKYSGPGFDRSVAVGFAGCVLAFVLISVVSNVITEVIVLWYYVAFAAAAYAITKFPVSEREPEPVPISKAIKVTHLLPEKGPSQA